MDPGSVERSQVGCDRDERQQGNGQEGRPHDVRAQHGRTQGGQEVSADGQQSRNDDGYDQEREDAEGEDQ